VGLIDVALEALRLLIAGYQPPIATQMKLLPIFRLYVKLLGQIQYIPCPLLPPLSLRLIVLFDFSALSFCFWSVYVYPSPRVQTSFRPPLSPAEFAAKVNASLEKVFTPEIAAI
jgi:hypothetical protein